MLFPTFEEVLHQHKKIIERTGGAQGLRDAGALKSSLTQPQMSFDGEELYPTIAEKAAILGFSIILNHPFLDGNKRIGYVVMEVFLVINGHELLLEIDEQEAVILKVAAGEMNRETFTDWVKTKIVQLSN
jgi:death-on-curing protein